MNQEPMVIQPWIEEQLQTLITAQNAQELLQNLVKTAHVLEFDYCAFGLRAPYPLTAPKAVLVSNYPEAWQTRYLDNRYLEVDPVVRHGMQSTALLAWEAQPAATAFWEEAHAQGIRHGLSQSYCDTQKIAGMLTLARSAEAIGARELAEKAPLFAWLTQLAYAGFAKFLRLELIALTENPLTRREIDVLRLTAEGKTASEIALLLTISERTVNFHINNTLAKLGAANKTAAAVQAALLGFI